MSQFEQRLAEPPPEEIMYQEASQMIRIAVWSSRASEIRRRGERAQLSEQFKEDAK